MSWQKLSATIMLLSLVSCSGMNSELNTPYVKDKKMNLKPRCNFKVKDNCWNRSLSLLMECVPAMSEEHPDLLSLNRRICKSQTGKEINFVDPLDLANEGDVTGLEFRVYNGLEQCFRFVSQGKSFLIDETPYGQLKVTALSNGDTHVSCFNGESFLITDEVKQKGCRNEKALPEHFVPQASLQKTLNREGSFHFLLKGNGNQPTSIFNCRTQ